MSFGSPFSTLTPANGYQQHASLHLNCRAASNKIATMGHWHDAKLFGKPPRWPQGGARGYGRHRHHGCLYRRQLALGRGLRNQVHRLPTREFATRCWTPASLFTFRPAGGRSSFRGLTGQANSQPSVGQSPRSLDPICFLRKRFGTLRGSSSYVAQAVLVTAISRHVLTGVPHIRSWLIPSLSGSLVCLSPGANIQCDDEMRRCHLSNPTEKIC